MAKENGNSVIHLPFYARASLILVGLFVFVSMLALGEGIIVPILFATVLSILLSSVVDFLERKKIERIFAIWIAIFLLFFIGFLVGFFVFSRVNVFIDQLPDLMARVDVLQEKFVSWLTANFDVRQSKVNGWINEFRSDVTSMSGERIGSTISFLGDALIIMILIPVYIFLMLYYQPLLVDFVHSVVGNNHSKDVGIVLGETRTILKSYFLGLLIELVIIAVLNSIGFIILGIQYAILIGILGALLNMVPYIGGLITLGLSMFMAMVSTGDPSSALYAAILFFIIQTFDNYFLLPRIVASKVRINALVAIIVVIAGGAIWGIAGMFLALPLTAIMKVIFDRIDPLKPWGFVLGDTMPPMVRLKFRGKKKT